MSLKTNVNLLKVTIVKIPSLTRNHKSECFIQTRSEHVKLIVLVLTVKFKNFSDLTLCEIKVTVSSIFYY